MPPTWNDATLETLLGAKVHPIPPHHRLSGPAFLPTRRRITVRPLPQITKSCETNPFVAGLQGSPQAIPPSSPPKSSHRIHMKFILRSSGIHVKVGLQPNSERASTQNAAFRPTSARDAGRFVVLRTFVPHRLGLPPLWRYDIRFQSHPLVSLVRHTLYGASPFSGYAGAVSPPSSRRHEAAGLRRTARTLSGR